MASNDGSLARILIQNGFSAMAAQAVDKAIDDAGIGAQATPGGVGAVDATSGLLISNVSGQDFAQLPVGPSPERAIQVSSFVPRHGTRAALVDLSGVPNEVGTVSDLGGIALFTGTPGGAKFIYPDNAGRTMLYETDATEFNSVIVDVPNDVSLLVVRNTGPAAPSFDGLAFRFANSPRDVRKPLRIIKDAAFAWGANDDGLSLDGAATDAAGFGVLDFLYDGTTFQVVSAVSVAADGSTSVGKGGVANGTRTTLIGSGARAFADNEIAFSTPVFSGAVLNQRGTSVCQLAGLTSSVTTSCVLTDSGTASDPGLPIDMAYLNGVVAYRIEVLGKRNSSTDFCRFVRDAVVQIGSSGALTLVTPSTQNNPADIFVGSITGNTITLAVDDVNKTLKITVTGSTTPQAMRWYARVEAMKMGNS